jgi:hypothetical protein
MQINHSVSRIVGMRVGNAPAGTRFYTKIVCR